MDVIPHLFESFFVQLKNFKADAYAVGLGLKTALDRSSAMRGLNRVGEKFPHLSEVKFDEKENKFVLRSRDVTADKQATFILEDYKSFTFAWGPNSELDIWPEMKMFYSTIEEGFEVLPIVVEFLDLKLYAYSDWEGHHYRAIHEAFFKHSPLSSACAPKLILQNDLKFRCMIDEHRKCVLSIISDVSDNEIIQGVFKNDKLRILIGAAQVQGISRPLVDTFEAHFEVAVRFVKEAILSNIVAPLDKAISDLSQQAAN